MSSNSASTAWHAKRTNTNPTSTFSRQSNSTQWWRTDQHDRARRKAEAATSLWMPSDPRRCAFSSASLRCKSFSSSPFRASSNNRSRSGAHTSSELPSTSAATTRPSPRLSASAVTTSTTSPPPPLPPAPKVNCSPPMPPSACACTHTISPFRSPARIGRGSRRGPTAVCERLPPSVAEPRRPTRREPRPPIPPPVCPPTADDLSASSSVMRCWWSRTSRSRSMVWRVTPSRRVVVDVTVTSSVSGGAR